MNIVSRAGLCYLIRKGQHSQGAGATTNILHLLYSTIVIIIVTIVIFHYYCQTPDLGQGLEFDFTFA